LSAKSESSDIDSALTTADDALLKMKTLFLDLTPLLNSTIASADFSQIELDGLIASVNASRNDVSSKRTQLINTIQSLQTAKDTKETRVITNTKNKTDLEITYEKSLKDLEDTKKQASADIYASEAGIKQLEASLSSQDAMIKRAQASISAVQAELAKTTVRSPISGTVANIAVKKGELVSAGKIVAEIVNTEGLQVKAYVPGTALSSIAVGGSVMVENRLVGKILHIAPSINQITKKAEIIVSITPTEDSAFLVGQFVELKVLGNADLLKNQPILIPLQAVKIGSESHEIYIVSSENIVEAVPVETGKLIGDKIEIISDLSMYDSIISEVRGIEAGQLVNLTK
jgi:RND family efflux transporter MFP subunit